MLRDLLRRLRHRSADGERHRSGESVTDEAVGDADGTDGEADGAEGDADEGTDADAGDRRADEDDPGDGSDSVWDLIPSWQYDGRHVEAGGLTRSEQERAIRDVQRRADAIEADEELVDPDADDVPDHPGGDRG